MKKSIKLAILFLLINISAFAAIPPQKITTSTSPVAISLYPLHTTLGIAVNVQNAQKAKSYVTFYDKENNILLKDFLPGKSLSQKGYILSELENGDYNIVITAGQQTLKKQIHIYDEYGEKTYIVLQ